MRRRESNLLLMDSGCFPEAFFDLSTRFAGEFIQKLQNYGITAAAVLRSDPGQSERFKEFLSEARRGRQFRVFSDREEAEMWLCAT